MKKVIIMNRYKINMNKSRFQALRWKFQEYKDLKIAGIKRSLIMDFLSVYYREETYKIWVQLGKMSASKFGISFNENTPDNLLHEVYLRHIYDIPGFVPTKDEIIIDVGANVGDTSIYWAKLYGAKVLAFEPLSESFEIMRENISLNGLDDLITPYNLALGDGTDISFNMSGYMMKYSMDSLKKIKTERLDNFNFNNISMIKIDVEGFELHVLRGAIETIKRNKPRIIIETHSKELRKRTNEILSSVGYSLIYRDKSRRGEGFMDEVTNLFYRCL